MCTSGDSPRSSPGGSGKGNGAKHVGIDPLPYSTEFNLRRCFRSDLEVFCVGQVVLRRRVLLANWFLESWGAKAQKRHMFKNIMVCWPCRLRRQDPQNTRFWKMCGLLDLAPQASQKTFVQKTLRGPFETLFCHL
jgi:hypothetical protein